MDTICYSGSQSWGCLLKDDSINTLGKTQDKTLMFAHQLFSPGPPRVSRLYYTIICSSQLFGKKSQIWLFFPVGLSIQSNLVLPKSENQNTGNIFQAMTLSIHLSKRQRQATKRVNIQEHIFLSREMSLRTVNVLPAFVSRHPTVIEKKYRWWEQTQHLLWQITHM